MMAVLALSLAYTGLAGLCLAMPRHHRQVWTRDPRPAARTGLRVAGWLCLALSPLPCVVVWGAAAGTVAWFGVLSAAGFVLAFSLPHAPRATAVLGLFTPVVAALSAVIATA